MTYLTLKEIQSEEKKILKAVTKFLDTHNIKYYLWAGTLLGAVRHKGFIPWDDDIDIGIKRDDYDKLIELLKQKNNKIDNYNCIGFELNNEIWPFIKVINSRIKIKEKMSCDRYLWIDIFPFDKIGNNYFWNYKFVILLRKIWFLKRYDYLNLQNEELKGIRKIFKKIILLLLKPISLNTYTKLYLKYIKRYKYNKKIIKYKDIVWANSKTSYIMENEFIQKKFQFNNDKFYSFDKYDQILSRIYGNYMILPKKEEQKTHKFNAWRVD